MRRDAAMAGVSLAVGLAVAAVFLRGSSGTVDASVLERDYVRMEGTISVWRASSSERAIHYLRNLGQVYTNQMSRCRLELAMPIYSLWAAKPVYVSRRLMGLEVGPITVEAYTHEGVVRGFEKALETNGVVFRRLRRGDESVVVVGEK